jgi:hypothetical protein
MSKNDFGCVIIEGLDYSGGIGNSRRKSNVITEPVKGPGLQPRTNGQQTIQIQTSNFSGNVIIEATLSRDPFQGPWSAIPLINGMNGESAIQLTYIYPMSVVNVQNSGRTIKTNKIYNIVGQYSWIRANISNISNGILQSIKVA